MPIDKQALEDAEQKFGWKLQRKVRRSLIWTGIGCFVGLSLSARWHVPYIGFLALFIIIFEVSSVIIDIFEWERERLCEIRDLLWDIRNQSSYLSGEDN